MSTFEEVNSQTNTNRASTFDYSDADAQRILIPNETLGTAVSCDELKYKLEKLRRKETRLLLHASTLSEYWRNKRIPFGLRMTTAPTLGKDDEQFLKRWGEIMNKCSFDLMLLIIEQCTSDAQQLKTEIELQEEELKAKFGQEYTTIDSAIKVSINKYKEKELAKKLRKYKRDADDYLKNEVYEWDNKAQPSPPSTATQPSRAAARPPFNSRGRGTAHDQRGRPGRHPREDSSSMDSDFMDSDSSTSARSSSFLGAHKTVPRRKKDAGVANVHPGTGHRPWTRSYNKR